MAAPADLDPRALERPETIIRAIVFSDDMVEITYMTFPFDVRANGAVTATHSMAIATGDDYEEGIEDAKQAVLRLLQDAQQDFAATPPFLGPEDALDG